MTKQTETSENIIIGGGWSGVEAARKIALTNKKTLLITTNLDTIGWNQFPEQEQDSKIKKALEDNGALFAKVECTSAGQRWSAARIVKNELDKLECLSLKQDTIETIESKGNHFVLTGASGMQYKCKNLIVCMGTFIGASVKIGAQKTGNAGRDNEKASSRIKASFKKLKVGLKRSKTAYPAVVCARGELKSQVSGKNAAAPSFEVTHLVAKGEELTSLNQHKKKKNLYFAGRCAGTMSAQGSALNGLVAGLAVIGKKIEGFIKI